MDEPTLADRRKALGLSQQAVASLAKCSLAMVSLLERGYHPEDSPVRARVVRALERAEEKQAA